MRRLVEALRRARGGDADEQREAARLLVWRYRMSPEVTADLTGVSLGEAVSLELELWNRLERT